MIQPNEYSDKLSVDDVLELLTRNAINSKNVKEIANKLLITFVLNYSRLPKIVRDEFFRGIGYIWKSASRGEAIIALCRLRAASPKKLMTVTRIPHSNLSRDLRYFESTGLISKTQKTKVPGSKGGPKTTIWGIYGCKPEDIREAIEEHFRISSPAFSEAERLAQLMLDELKGDECRLKDIQGLVRKNSSGYDRLALINLVSTQLQQKGIAIWR